MRDEPRITANKLAEYMEASFARKRAILQEQKFPQAFAIARWGQAERPISNFVASGSTDLSTIDNEISRLISLNPDSEFKEQNRDLCVDALQSFKLLSNQLPFDRFTRGRGALQQKMLIPINGVDVSVHPQVIFEAVNRKGTKLVGGVKFSFPKSNPLNQSMADYVSALVHWHCEEFLSSKGKPELRMCYSVDMPTSTVFEPPKTYKRRRQQIAEACSEIVQRWPKLPPP